jgi:HK97 family phage major capsid protein
MPTDLKASRAEALKSAQDVIDLAKKEDRDLTDDEQKVVEGHFDAVKTYDTQMKGRALIQSIRDLGGATDEPSDDEHPAKSLGDFFAKNVDPSELVRLKAQSGYTVATPEFKAATDPQVTTGAVFKPVLTDIDRTIVQAFRPGPVVADLLSSGSISGNAISYFIEGAVEGGFATVAEAGAKPQMHFADPTSATDALKKIAAWWDSSDEMAEDLAYWVSEINNRGLYLLSMFEEAQLVSGNGAGTNILGLLNRNGIQTEDAADADDDPDALFRAMTKVQTATGLAADGIIINPADYQKLRLSRDANGQYFGGGFFAGQYGQGGVPLQPPLWGLSTVVSTAVAAGTAVVGAFKQAATVYRKGGVRVETTNSDLGKFTSNIITTRIEERIALAVRVPSAIVKVTLL